MQRLVHSYSSNVWTRLLITIHSFNVFRDPLLESRIKHLLLQSGVPHGGKQAGLGFAQRVIRSLKPRRSESAMEKNIGQAIRMAPNMVSAVALSIWLDKIMDPWYL